MKLKALLSGISAFWSKSSWPNPCSGLFQSVWLKWTNNDRNFMITSLHSILVYWMFHLFTSPLSYRVCMLEASASTTEPPTMLPRHHFWEETKLSDFIYRWHLFIEATFLTVQSVNNQMVLMSTMAWFSSFCPKIT